MTHATSAARWLARRALLALLVIAGVTTLTFVLIHLAPGDPIYLLAGDGGNASYYDSMRAKYGLDRPIAEQFVRYVRAVLSGDLGYSFMYQQPVIGVVLDHLPATLLLGGTSLLFSVTLGFGAAVLCAIWRARWLDVAVGGVSSIAYSAPVYWTGQIFILIAAVKLGVLPAGGMGTSRESLEGIPYIADLLWHLFLPAFTLSLPLAAVIARVSRASMM
ncbi:MAG: ABC transporter permease, partial [Acidobacteria bacterium]|nr:ABC transporter permease [Acidobacteriota bacterium]